MSETISKTIERLEAKRAGVWQEGQALLTAAEGEDRDLTDDEQTMFDSLMAPPDVNEAGAKIAGTGGELAKLDERIAKLKAIERAGFKSAAVTRLSASGDPLVDVKPKDREKGTFWAFLAHCKFVSGGSSEGAAAYARRQFDDHLAAWVLETPRSVLEGAMANLWTSAAVLPGTTGDADFANKLTEVRKLASQFRELWHPKSIVGRLNLNRLSFDGANQIDIPGQDSGTIGYWVGESAPIPADDLTIGEISLTPKNMGVLSVVSNQLLRRSTPQVLQIITNALTGGAARTADQRFVGNAAAAAGAPAGIRNGIAGTAGTAGADLDAIDTDAKVCIDIFNVQSVPSGGWQWVMPEAQKTTLRFIRDGLGQHAYKDEINSGQFNGYDVVESNNAPAAVLMLLASPHIFWADELLPMIEVSGEATVELDDAPAGDGTGLRSLFQRDEQAIRLTMAMDWARSRSAAVWFVHTVTW